MSLLLQFIQAGLFGVVALLALYLYLFDRDRLRRLMGGTPRPSRPLGTQISAFLLRSRRGRVPLKGKAAADAVSRPRWRLPRLSLSGGLVSLAVRRLPARMGAAEKRRWEEEMRADVAAIPGRLGRFLVAYRIWRKGTARMPTADRRPARPLATRATSERRNDSVEEFYRRLKQAPHEPPSEWPP